MKKHSWTCAFFVLAGRILLRLIRLIRTFIRGKKRGRGFLHREGDSVETYCVCERFFLYFTAHLFLLEGYEVTKKTK
jgi:hypothetical protein